MCKIPLITILNYQEKLLWAQCSKSKRFIQPPFWRNLIISPHSQCGKWMQILNKLLRAHGIHQSTWAIFFFWKMYLLKPGPSYWTRERSGAKNMLREECSCFSKTDDDIGQIENLKLSISLKDMDPVAHTYLYRARLGKEIQLALCFTNCLCKKEIWKPTSLHRLQTIKQEDSSW